MLQQETTSSETMRLGSSTLRHDIIPFATLMLDASYHIASCSVAAATLFGHAARVLIGQHISAILPGLAALQAGTYESHEGSASTRLSKIEMDAVHADGGRFPVLVSLLEEHESPSADRLLFVRNLSVPIYWR